MDLTTLNALIPAGAALAGVVVGNFINFWSSARQDKRRLARDRADAVRGRQEQAIRECESLFIAMADDAAETTHPFRRNEKEEALQTAREGRIASNYQKANAALLYLETAYRERIEPLLEVLDDVEEFCFGSGSFGGSHYDRPYTVAHHVRKEVRTLTAAFLQHAPLPPESRRIGEYRVVLTELYAAREEFYSLAEEHDDYAKSRRRARDDFFKRHPDLRVD